MVRRERKTTSPPPSLRPQRSATGRNSRGFTLIEILLVLAIIAMVMSLGLPAVQSITSQQINSTTRKFTGLIRTLRNDAILLNLIHRIGIDLDNQTWWVEQQKRLELLSEAAEEEDGGETPGAGNFGYADKYSTEPKPMPAGVVFSGVLTERFGLIKEGVVYIHFFPNGFVEQSILYLSKSGSEDVYYSLILRPTSGKVEIQPGAAEAF